MSIHLWPNAWFDISDGAEALENIAQVWAKRGYNTLVENDYARLEPFLEPFDAVYTDDEITILSRLGHNGVQKEYCRMFTSENSVWVLEWYLEQGDIQRMYLYDIAMILYGKKYENDEAQCMIMLTHALASLRKLKLIVEGDSIRGVMESSLEEVEQVSLENADIE